MTSTRLSAREALAEASDFARDVWRDCWPVMLLVIIGRTLVFLGHHVSSVEWRPGAWPVLGEVLTIGYIPLFGALYRLGVGGPALDSLGWGGFQWTGVEWRLLGVWIVLGFALLICATPLAIVSFPLLYLFQHHAAVSLGPLGGWSFASILLAPFWLAFAAAVLFMGGRLGLAAARTTAQGRVSPFAGWSLTRGMGWRIGLSWLVTQLPMVFGWIGLWAMGLAEAGDMSSGPAETWPLVDALGAGVVVAVLTVAIQAPLSVGLLSGVYRWLAEEDREIPDAPRGEEATASLVEPATIAPAPDRAATQPVEQGAYQALSSWPHTVMPRRSRVADACAALDEGAPKAEISEPAPPEPDTSPPLLVEPPEPPLASAPEPDQITAPHESVDGPEPHT